MEVQTPYLDAIQAIPGDVPGEKFKWIAKLIKERLSECKDLEEVIDSEKIPRYLAPLVQVQAAMMLNKKNRENQCTYAAIAEALKSDDVVVVNRALQAKSFFDGSNKNITNVQYFFNNLFPFVSLNTRTRIIKKLSIHLAPKEPSLAEEFFNSVATTYGIEQALPLLPACSESFMYRTIMERKIQLSRKLVKTIYRKNPDFIVRYFKLNEPVTSPYTRNLRELDISDFADFVAALVKKRLDSFVEVYEMHSFHIPGLSLSNKCAEAFIKNGKRYLQEEPRRYIKLLPLKMISESRMETIYPKLFPLNIKDYNTDTMLDYLKYYPQEKKLDLFLRSFQKAYGRNVLDEPKHVTPMLMKLLPSDERARQARIKMKQDDSFEMMYYERVWRCYLPISESIPEIKQEIATTSQMEYRAALLCQMIYSCKVNNDQQALLEVLTYLRDRHKNEQSLFLLKVFECLVNLYSSDLPQMSEAHWAVLLDIIIRAHVKNDLPPVPSINVRMLEAAIHHKILQNQSIEQLIGIFIDVKIASYDTWYNILVTYPEYERTCLEACIAVLSQRNSEDKSSWKKDKVSVLYDVFRSIYRFNESHVKPNSRIQRMSVKDYPWLLKEMERILNPEGERRNYVIENICSTLQKHEKDLYERLCKDKEKKKGLAVINTDEALMLLKKNPERISAEWKEYFNACVSTGNLAAMKRFVKATRWYKEIPKKFVEQCLHELTKEKQGMSLIILAALVHGHTYAKIIEPMIPTNRTIDIHHEEAKTDYNLSYYLISGMKIANPPVPLTLLGRFCDSDYLSIALSALTNLCRRTPLMDVISFARTLAAQRVSVRKHGIRMLHLVAPRAQLHDFLLSQWKTEEHYSIQEVLFSKACDLFREEPGPATWSLLSEMVSTFTAKNAGQIDGLIGLTKVIPNEYIVDFIKLLLRTIDNLADAGFSSDRVNSFFCSLLTNIDPAICNLMPEELTELLLRRFLFHSAPNVSRAARHFVIDAHLVADKDHLDARMKTFSNIFVEFVKSGWNVPHPTKPHYYPMNYAVHKFIESFVNHTLRGKLESALIDAMLETFLTVLTPQMDASSYLSLVYLKENATVSTYREFGAKLGQRVAELVQTFTPLFISFMADVLEKFLSDRMVDNEEDLKLGVMEGLMEVGSVEATLMAVKLLSLFVPEEYYDRYSKLLTMFSKYDHPAIKSLLCDTINRMEG